MKKKLTVEIAELVREQHKNGANAKALAYDYGVNLSSIYSIIRGDTYKVKPTEVELPDAGVRKEIEGARMALRYATSVLERLSGEH